MSNSLINKIKNNKLVRFGAQYIDYSMAWKGALFLALVVYAINFSHGAIVALPAAIKQGTYTFFVAGFITKLCESLSLKKTLGVFAIHLATFIPSCIAIGLTYLLHNLKGTPEPLYSTLPTLLMAPPAFCVLAWRYQKTQKEEKSHD